MVSVSEEAPEETDARLRRVVSEADLEWLPGEWSFAEPPASVGAVPPPAAIAAVRDDDGWSYLVPSEDDAAERFAVWSFHFPQAQDNSGFVGWLATELKRRLGTGVFVVCGYNSRRGGVYDYWGCPAALAGAAAAELDRLRALP